MATPLSQILSYQSIDLTPYEIRGVKPGIDNSYTTGPVYVDGTYVPYHNILDGTCFLDRTDSSRMTTISFNSPYSPGDATPLNAFALRQNDLIMTLGTSYTVGSVVDATSVLVDRNFDSTSSTIVPCTFQMGLRDYLIEPDTQNNDSFGYADFTNGSTAVTGHGTNWLGTLAPGDSIKNDYYQYLYQIHTVLSDTQLTLMSPYGGDTTSMTTYTARKTAIGREVVDYVKNNFIYDNKSGRWAYDATTGNDLTTSTSFLPFIDGIELSYTKSLYSTFPDLVETALALNLTLAQSTTYDTFQFPMPKVPHPETMKLYLNGALQDQFPNGDRNYILDYSQNPVYEFPPPPSQRPVCNIMFLKGITRNLNPVDTENGLMVLTDASGKSITEIMPGSELIQSDGTTMVANRDYILESNAGVAAACDYNIGEHLVKYVYMNLSGYIDNGFSVYLNGVHQQISFPASSSDDVLFQPYNGRLKPANQDRPGPNDAYEVHYMVESTPVTNETINSVEGAISFNPVFWPIETGSILLTVDGIILTEGTDYIVSYQTGVITLTNSVMHALSLYKITYTPLAKQVNTLTYTDSWFCTSQDSRLIVADPTNYTFQIHNTNLDLGDSSSQASILRVYNETKDKDYNLSGLKVSKQTITLSADATNIAIGLSSTDIVVADYRFANPTLEYAPVVIPKYTVPGGSKNLIMEGVDLSRFFQSGVIVNLTSPGISYTLPVTSASYNGTDTIIVLGNTIPADIVNPTILVSDAPVIFNNLTVAMSPVMAGGMTVSFPGNNITRLFRPNVLLGLGGYYYAVSSAAYDHQNRITNVILSSPLIADVTTSLINTPYSDCPVYLEGTTEVIPADPAISVLPIPGLTLCQKGFDTIPVVTDASNLNINGIYFPYASYPTLGDMSSAIDASTSTLAVTAYAPAWPSRKLLVTSDVQYLYKDSSTILAVQPELRRDGTDVSYTVQLSGTVLLPDPLVAYQRYDFDYLGQRFLGDATISFAANYFTKLSKKSKLVASFEYDNLDQFYIQVLSQRDFFNLVTIPRLQQETQQLNGNVGQGGQVNGDTNAAGPSEGGLVTDIYRLKDAQIDKRIFKTIYDFFSDRVRAYGDEYQAIEGLKLFNNDGWLTEEQQNMATNPGNNSRVFPDANYTKYEPERVNPLTGEFRGTAIFLKGGGVSGSGTLWTQQLGSSDFIGRADSTKRYMIANVLSDSSVQLTVPYAEVNARATFSASAQYPAYDDDGNMGAKIIGTKSGDFGLAVQPVGGDTFDAAIDGHGVSYTFTTPSPLPDPLMSLLFSPATLSPETVATMLTNSFNSQLSSTYPGGCFRASVESVLDPDNIWRRTAIVLRTVYPANTLALGNGSAVPKLGFTPGDYAAGNFDRTSNLPEAVLLRQEGALLTGEAPSLQVLWNEGIPDSKMTRILPIYLPYADNVREFDTTEGGVVQSEIQRLYTEIWATSVLIEEPSLPTYLNNLTAFVNALAALPLALDASAYDSSVYLDWEGKGSNWKWVLDWSDSTQTIRGKNSLGNGVDATSGTGIINIDGESTFNLTATPGYDLRVMDATVYGTFYEPRLYYQDTSSFVDGTWNSWDTTAAFSQVNAVGQYSHDNTVSFTIGNTTQLFYLGLDPISPNPFYQTGVSDLTLSWYSSYGTHAFPFTYAAYPDVASMTSALTALPGFLAYALCSPGYDYTNMSQQTVNIGPYPGAVVSTGAGSPAFSMWYDSTYSAGVTSLTVGASVLNYASYPTLGNLTTAINALTGYTVLSNYAPDYIYGSFTQASGDVSSSPPGTVLFFNSNVPAITLNFTGSTNPAYLVDATSLQIFWTYGGTNSATFLFVDYPQVGDMVDAVAAVTGFIATPIVNRTYPYGYINPVPYTALSATPAILTSDRNLFSIAFIMDGTYQTTSTALMLSYIDGTSSYSATKNYTSFPTLQNLVTSINAETYFSASLINTSGPYLYGSLKTAGPSLFTTAQLFLHPQSSAIEILSYNPTFACDTTALALSFPDSTSTVFQYMFYPSLGSLETAIDAVNGISVAGIYDASYHYTYLETASGTLSSSPYSTFIHFSTVNPAPLLSVLFDTTNLRYTIDKTAMNLMWAEFTTPIVDTFKYTDYTSVYDMKYALNQIPGVYAFGNPIYDSNKSRSFKLVTDATNLTYTDATVYPGLRSCYVTYSTITDRLLSDRMDFVTDRSSQVSSRLAYVDGTRESQIKQDMGFEQLLRTNTGDVGDLWTWANLRFNRRQGCDARLNQIEAQIASNQSALATNHQIT